MRWAERRRRVEARQWSLPWRTQLWPVGVLYTVLAFGAVLSNATGSYIGDNRYEQYVNPARRLAKGMGAWDPTRGLGAPREDLWPGTTIPGAIARGLGMSPWVGERCFHALCLVTMALGVTALLRLFRPRIGIEHLVASLYAAFGPYSAAFLVPTNLYYMMALGPWLVVALVRGVTGEYPWRWAASFALLVAWAGNPDAPGLVYNAVILIITAIYLVHVERVTRWRDVLRWTAVMGALALLCSAWALTKTYVARDMLNARLVDTELPSVSALTSSWSESMRGLGNWLSYFATSTGLLKPQGVGYFANAWVVIASFIVPLVALVALWRVKWRAKVLFGSMIVVSAALIVGGFEQPTKSPIGAAILWVMEHVTVASSFRNTYKAGGGLAIGVGVLAGVGVAAMARRVRHRSRMVRSLPALGSVIVLVTVSFPFWNGSLYHPYQRVAGVPDYWTEAFDYLDQLPDPGLTAVVPAITRANYRWGWVGDDIFDALLARPHAVSTGVPLSNPLGANALEVFTAAAQSLPYRPGVLASMARRLGITEVVVRNDLTWESLSLPRPAAFEGLRHDPDFERVGSFGEPGVGVVALRDHSNSAILERSLPPVEIYRVRQPGSLLTSVDSASAVVVAGDANAWTAMQTTGLVAATSPVMPSGAIDDASIADAVRNSAGVVVTDTARRRLRTLVDYEPSYSATLALTQDAGRLVREQYPETPSAQSTTWFTDATAISPVGMIFSQIPAAFRPSNAFDGDLSTAFAVNWVLADSVPGVEVQLRVPTSVSRFDITSTLSLEGVPGVKRVSVTLSDGTQRQSFTAEDGSARIEFPAQTTSSFVIRMEGIDRRQGLVGLSEVKVDDLDLREFVQAPTDLFGGRGTIEGIDAALAEVPAAYLFGRSARTSYLNAGGTASGRFEEDQTIRRRFDVVRAGPYTVSGLLRRSGVTSAPQLDRWIGGDVSASASASDPAGLEGLPVDAIDGSLQSAWISRRAIGDTLTVSVPSQRIQRIEVAMQIEGPAVGASLVTATVGDTSVAVSPVADASCPPFLLADIQAEAAAETEPSTVPCYRRAVFTFGEPVLSDEVTLTLEQFDKRINRFGVQWFVNEVDVSGPDRSAADNKVDRSASVGGSCVDVGLQVGSPAKSIPVDFQGTVGDLLDGVAIPFEACGTASLPPGAARLETEPHGLFEAILLRSADWFPDAPARAAWTANPKGPDRVDAMVDMASANLLVFGQSFDPLWTMSIDGKAAAAPLPTNGLNGWIVPAGRHDLSFRYEPGGVVTWSILVTVIGVGVSILLLGGRRRRQVVASSMDGWTIETISSRSLLSAVIVATLVGALLVGPLALVVGVAGLLVVRSTDDPVAITGIAAPILFLIAACSSVTPLLFGSTSFGLSYSSDREWAHQLTLVAMVFAVLTIALLAVSSRRTAPVTGSPMMLPWTGLAAAVRTNALAALSVIGAGVVGVVGSVWNRDAGGVGGLVQQIRFGTKYSVDAFGGDAAVDLAPLAPVVRAVVQVAPALLQGLVVAGICLVSIRWVRGRDVDAPTWLVALAVAVSPLSWGVGLGGQCAALLVLCALLMGRRAPAVRWAGAIGVLLGAAVLARPDAVLAVAAVAAVMLARRRPLHAAAFAGAAVATCASWAAFCWGAGTAPWLASSAARMVLDESVAGPGHWLPWWGALVLLSAAWRVYVARVGRGQ